MDEDSLSWFLNKFYHYEIISLLVYSRETTARVAIGFVIHVCLHESLAYTYSQTHYVPPWEYTIGNRNLEADILDSSSRPQLVC